MGWNGSDRVVERAASSFKKKETTKSTRKLRILPCAICALVACICGLALYLIFAEPESTPVAQKETPKKRVPAPIKVTPTTPKKVVEEVVVKKEKPKKPAIDMASKTPEERREIRFQKFKEKELDMTVPSNRVFRTGTEQIMSWIFTTEIGDLPPPLPKIPDSEMAHFAKILMSDNPLKEGDTEFTANAKEMVALAKKEMIDYIDKGGTPEEFFDYYRGQLVQAHEKRKNMRGEVMKVLREEPEIALQYLDEVNAELAKDGIKPIKLHPKQLKHFGITVDENNNATQGEIK